MNGEDLRARVKAETRFAEQQLSHDIAHAIVDLVRSKYPRAKPEVVFAALAGAMASLIVLCTPDKAQALAGAEVAYRALRTAVIHMLLSKHKRAHDGPAEKADT